MKTKPSKLQRKSPQDQRVTFPEITQVRLTSTARRKVHGVFRWSLKQGDRMSFIRRQVALLFVFSLMTFAVAQDHGTTPATSQAASAGQPLSAEEIWADLMEGNKHF